jgi:hypothetical protein
MQTPAMLWELMLMRLHGNHSRYQLPVTNADGMQVQRKYNSSMNDCTTPNGDRTGSRLSQE